jgi:hypothetical protein
MNRRRMARRRPIARLPSLAGTGIGLPRTSEERPVTSHRHRASMSAPLSTKLVVWLGLLLVAAGFAVAGWDRLSGDDAPDNTSPTAQAAQQYLPDLRTVVGYLAVIAIAVVGGAYVLIRARRRRAGL